MAEVDFDEFEDAVYAPPRNAARAVDVQRLVNMAGAVSSVALVIFIARPGASASRPAKAAKAPVEMDPATIAVGTRLAQLGAFDTPDEARAKWASLAIDQGEVMDGKALVIQPAQSGGKTFYRLRTGGFADQGQATAFCDRVKAKGASCSVSPS
mgnify:CR=1 FL=1